MSGEAERKRPAENPAPLAQGSAAQAQPPQPRISLADQIEFLEALAEEQGEAQPPSKKKVPAVHSLTQNTTHREIRVGPQFQAVLPPVPPPRK